MTTPLDPIREFLGKIPNDEYQQRRRILNFRNAASYKVTKTENYKARTLIWIVAETAHEWAFAPASVEDLTEAADFLLHLMHCADLAVKLEGNQ